MTCFGSKVYMIKLDKSICQILLIYLPTYVLSSPLGVLNTTVLAFIDSSNRLICIPTRTQ